MRRVWLRRIVFVLLALGVLVLLWRRRSRAPRRGERVVGSARGGLRLVGWALLVLLFALGLSEWTALRAFVGAVTRFRPGMSTDDAVWVVATVAILGAVVLLALRLIASGEEERERRLVRRDDDEPRRREEEPSPRGRVVVRPAHTRQLAGSEPEDREEEHDRVYRRGGRHRGSAFRG